jgi:hypothetical protein
VHSPALPRTAPGLAALALASCICLLRAEGLYAATPVSFQGQVTVQGTGAPVEGARITLDLQPDGAPEHGTESSAFGFASFRGVVSGTYQLRVEHPAYVTHTENVVIPASGTLTRNMALTPNAGTFFDIFVQVSDVTSGLQLGGVPLVVERYSAALDTVAQFTTNLVTDTNGFGVFRGMSSGHYRFVANSGGAARPKWIAHENVAPAGAKPLLTGAHMANLLLKAQPQELHVQVTGYNPVTLVSGQGLTNFFVELTGLDPLNTNRVIVPTRTGVTEVNGRVKFDLLPAIAWRITAKKLGYNPATQIVFPNASGDFIPGNSTGNPVVLAAGYIPTHLYVNSQTPYRDSELFNFLNMRIEGLTNSTSEGVSRVQSFYNVTGLRDDRSFSAIAAGRYRVAINTQPQFGLQGIRPLFVGEDYVDVPPGRPEFNGFSDLILPLQVVPATVRGRLFVAEEAGRVASPDNPYAFSPRYLPKAGVVIEFVEFTTDLLLRPAFRTNTVTTDASGEFTAQMLPARYGVRIPGLSGYYGREVRMQNLTTTTPSEQAIVQSWPHPEPWPWPGGLHGDPLRFHSGHDQRIDLFVEKQATTIALDVPVNSLGAAVTATLRTSPGNEAVQTLPVPYDGAVRFFDVPPGNYTYTLTRPWFAFTFNANPTPTPIAFNTPAIYTAPGVLPTADPGGSGFTPPFTTLVGDNIDYSFTNGTATIQVRRLRWNPGTTMYDDLGTSELFPQNVKADDPTLVPGGIPPVGGFSFRLHIVDVPHIFYHTNHVASGGTHTIDVYYGTPGNHGPLGNVLESIPPEPPTPFGWTVLFINRDDPAQLITSPTSFVITSGGTNNPHTASGQFLTNTAGAPTIGFFDNHQWQFVSETTYYTNGLDRLTLVRFQRATAVSGGVTNDTTNLPIPNARVQVKDRFGRVLREALADANGQFAFAQKLDGANPVFLDVTAPGFKPHRARFTAADALPVPSDPDDSTLAASARLEPIFPSPLIENVTLDRQGLFLPGVRLAGNEGGMTGPLAAPALTLTWTLMAKSDPVNASLVPFDAADGASSGPQNVVLNDPIQEVWLIDPRGFTNSSFSGTPIAMPPPVGQGYQAIHLWLHNIVTNQTTNVFYQRVTNLFATGQSGQIATTNTVSIWKLPPGDFKPVFLAVTQRGAIALHDPFETPGTPAQLKGIPLPRWFAFASDLIGGAAWVGATQEKLREWVPEGDFVPLPDFTTAITSDENGFLCYDYNLAVEWTAAQDAPGAGLLALAPGLLGLQFNGNLNFGLNGASTNLFLDARADVSLPDVRLPRFFPKAATNSVAPDNIEVEESTLHVEARTLAARNFAPATQPYEFELTNSVGGSYSAAIKANLKPVTGKLPYIGPVLLSLDKTGALEISGVMDGAIGLKRTNTWRTPFPPSIDPDTTPDTNKHTMRRHFLGGTERDQQLALCFRFGAGIDVTAFSGRGNARAKLNLQGNDCALGPGDAAKPAALVDFNPHNDWPPIRRITGNLTATLDASVSAWIVEFGKSWEWELLAFEHSYNTEPFFELIPMNVASTVVSPATATASTFNGNGPVLIENFFAAGSFATAKGGNSEALSFTDVDTGTGNMRLKVALRTDANPFGTPVTVATAAGIAAVDVAALPGGGWMVVWTQLAPGDVGNPFPPSAIMSATSTDGVNWSSPAQAVSLAGVASGLHLITGDTLVGLAYLWTADGPEATLFSADVVAWNGTSWNAPSPVVSNARAMNTQGPAPGAAQSALIVIATESGALEARLWNGSEVSAAVLVTASSGRAFATTVAPNGDFFLAQALSDGGIELFKSASPGVWTTLGLVVSQALPAQIRLTPLTDGAATVLLLTWVEGGDVTSVHTAFVSIAGALLRAPANLSLNAAGRFAALEVLPRAGREARVIARYEDGRVDVMELAASFGTLNALLDAPSRLPDGTFQFRFTGNPHQIYTLQGSSDFNTWFTITNLAAPASSLFILDPGAKGLPYRFYRAVSP